MSAIYVPVLKVAVSYTVSFGRRWSILEHMLLVELAGAKRTVDELSSAADLPPRMIIEGLINLLRNNWVEVRADEQGLVFAATVAGKLRAGEPELPAQLGRDTKFTSLCFDLLTGAWLRSDDLDLVYRQDLPADAAELEPIYQSFDERDGAFRDLLYLDLEERLEPEPPRLINSSRPYARIGVGPGGITGLPAYAPHRLREALLKHRRDALPKPSAEATAPSEPVSDVLRDTLEAEDILFGGEEHFALVCKALAEAKSAVVIHSCFVDSGVVTRLLPHLEGAAKRKVSVELLWGLNRDPDSRETPAPVTAAVKALDALPPAARKRVHMSGRSSGSHAKILLYDLPDGRWRSVVGSCNFLSSWYNALELSLCSKSQRLAVRLLGWLLTAQLPAAGAWPPTVLRLNALWNRARESSARHPETGEHRLALLVDQDHYATIRTARDDAERRILIGSDFYGIAAETSSVVPMESAAERGLQIDLFYQRPSAFLASEGAAPTPAELASRGITLRQLDKLHAKLLAWDDDWLAASSFNWLSTTSAEARPRGAELGLLVQAPAIVGILGTRLAAIPEAAPLLGALQASPERANATNSAGAG